MRKTILTVIGARPQFIKAAVISKALAERPDLGLKEYLVTTGQHFDPEMRDVFFRELGIPAPDADLGISGGSHAVMTARMLAAVELAIAEVKPAAVLLYGDTNSTLAGALAAAKLGVPVAHVEAGLRSFNRAMPEEINRVLTDHVSEWLFCPTTSSVANLAREGITRGVHAVGDVMYDLALALAGVARRDSSIIERLGVTDGNYVLATVHRQENTVDAPTLYAALDALRAKARHMPVILPLHPRLRQSAQGFGLSLEGLTCIAPVGYLDMTRLILGAAEIMTDSGGLQKEAYFHRVPCVTLRSETEWVETIDAGWNRLWTCPNYSEPRRDIPDYGTGQAGRRIVEILADGVADSSGLSK